ncbi:GNAT superfamily N-acetyltransferase [Kitasatospora gansuensis]|uniref:GNAT superfamily N-acetyltransferase n=1 Tax=Kitasatospora gansuensis TaxID=258050 RepID=A0A7W7WJ86_9ACTN|nr:GNAT family N-acetyltransferase [Kitasatospora gansuensis]MBB4949066.1 GNAT superfamily N-acetyltransferase [Kitasatospora gansuensis]
MSTAPLTWTVSLTAVDHPEAATVLYEYIDELASRYYGRQATSEEIVAALGDGADLREPRGALLVARDGAVPVGCVGLRWQGAGLADGDAELTRMFVRKAARRGGAGARLVGAAEELARACGAGRIRLNTRKDLVEAIALYGRLGYRPIDPYGDDPYAEVWLAKSLG